MDSSEVKPTADMIAAPQHSASVVAYLLNRAAVANLECPLRKGSCVHLPRRGHLMMTGDIHDNVPNLEKIIRLAALHKAPDRHLILHEIVHGPNFVNGKDLSIRTLARVAQLKLQFPNQVHILLANHELAQIAGAGISKSGVGVCEAFDAGVEFLYGDDAPLIHNAISRYVKSLTLAVRCDNGVFCSHSLPAPRKLDTFDMIVLERPLNDTDYFAGGAAYEMVWGRNHTQELADKLGRQWNAKLFVMGHQPADMGFDLMGESIMVMASNHEHGMALPIDLKKSYDMDSLLGPMIPLSSVILD